MTTSISSSATDQDLSAAVAQPKQRTRASRHLPLAMALICGMGALSGFFKGPTSHANRYDPERPKTAEDLVALAKAESKRKRKALRASGLTVTE